MASYGWRERRSVADGLFGEGHRFSFVQAVRLLEELFAKRTPPAEGVDPDRDVVRFRHAVRLDFPASDVEDITPPADGQAAEMTVNVLGLAGVLGPLPQAVSELILERTFHKDTALRDFLDIFNHRLISLLYRARKKYRPALDRATPDRGRVANVLFSLIGIGTPHLAERLQMPDRALLAYAGLLADRYRSAPGLVRMLEDYFGTKVEVVPFRGQWCGVAEPDVTRIGVRTGRNHALGRGAVLGDRVWDQSARFEVQLGPLSLDEFMSFLPVGRAFHPLIGIVQFFNREAMEFSVRPVLSAAEVPELRLGTAESAYLGWTTWLKTKPFGSDDAQVCVRGKALHPPLRRRAGRERVRRLHEQ